jgi:hypothetical protein
VVKPKLLREEILVVVDVMREEVVVVMTDADKETVEHN